jgi:Ca2+-binding EF-hand superfamily protein
LRIFRVVLFLAAFTGAAAASPESDYVASDANGDGLLQQPEFKAFITRRAKAGDGKAKWVVRFGAWGRALRTVDYDKDGQVSGGELRRYDKGG